VPLTCCEFDKLLFTTNGSSSKYLTKYTIEKDLTKKRKKEKQTTNTQTNDIYLSKAD